MSGAINRLRANQVMRQLDDINIHGVTADQYKTAGMGLQALTEVLATSAQSSTDAANKKKATDARAAATDAANAAQLAQLKASASNSPVDQQAALVAQQYATKLDTIARTAETTAGMGGFGQGQQGGQGQYGQQGQQGGYGQQGGQYPGDPNTRKNSESSIWVPVVVGVGALGVGLLLYKLLSKSNTGSGAPRGYARRSVAS